MLLKSNRTSRILYRSVFTPRVNDFQNFKIPSLDNTITKDLRNLESKNVKNHPHNQKGISQIGQHNAATGIILHDDP